MKTLLIIFAILIGGIYGSYLSGNGDQMVSALHEVEIPEKKIIPVVNAQEKSEPKVEEIVYEIARVFGKEGTGVVKKALDCFYAESKWNYKALHVNKDGSIDRGVTQLNSVHKLRNDEWFDYKANIAKSYQIYLSRGKTFKAWYAGECR